MAQTIKIDFTQQTPLISSSYAGEKGEKNAVILEVIPEIGMTNDDNVTFLYAQFKIAGGIVPSRFFDVDEEIKIPLWQQLTEGDSLEFRLVAENGLGTIISYSPTVKLYFGDTLTGATLFPQGESEASFFSQMYAFQQRWQASTGTATALPAGSTPTVGVTVGTSSVVFAFGIPKGETGATGRGITTVVKTSTAGLVDTYTITYSDSTTSTFSVTNGNSIVSIVKESTVGLVDTYLITFKNGDVSRFTVTNGAKGDKGDTGSKGDKGDTGSKGDKGDTGETGATGATGNGISSVTKTGTVGLVDTYKITFTNGNETTFNVTNGAKGDKGDTGNTGAKGDKGDTGETGATGATGATGNGIASITKTGTAGNVDTYTITYTNGTTSTFTVTNGSVTSVNGQTGTVVLDGDDIAYDSNDSVNDKISAHSQEIVQKADKDAYVETLEVGLADNLIDRKDIGSSEEIAYRTTHDKISVTEDGNADVQVIKGNTEKFNQLINKDNFPATQTINGVTFTNNGDGTITVNGTASADAQFSVYNLTANRSAKKYILCGCPSGGSTSTYYLGGRFIWTSTYNRLDTGNGSLINDDFSLQFSDVIDVTVKQGTTVNNLVFKPQLHDLTAMSLDTITIADFKAIYPKMYGYNAGQLINFNGTSLVTNGFNQWDEEWENGSYYISNGAKYDDASRIRSKNKTPIIPNTTYYFKQPSNITSLVCFWDASLNYIGYTNITATNTFTTPSDAHYFAISPNATYGNIYNNNICINLSWSGYRNGQYESYWSNTKSLDFVQTYFPNGMKSAGSAYDEINFKTHKAITRIGSVDLGSLEWNIGYRGTTPYFRTQFTGIKSSTLNIICTKYETSSSVYSIEDKKINATGFNWEGEINVFDSAYSTTWEFKAAMNGVIAYYELATPTEVDIPTSLTCTYPCADFGTERLTPSTYDLLTSPMKAQIHYNLDYTRQIENNILVSGENIKTVNNQSLLGSGNITVGGSSASSVTYDNTTSGLEATNVQGATDELSEKIVNCYDVDTTEEKVVGRYIYMDGAIKKSKPIYRQVLVTNSDEVSTNVGIDLLLKYEVSGKRSGGQIDSIPFYDSNSEYVTVWVNVTDANNSKLKFGIHGITYTQIISTINYTKTTDTPTVIE